MKLIILLSMCLFLSSNDTTILELRHRQMHSNNPSYMVEEDTLHPIFKSKFEAINYTRFLQSRMVDKDTILGYIKSDSTFIEYIKLFKIK